MDDKGRLKLPVKFQQFLAQQPLFVTTLNKVTARIYPSAVWDRSEEFLSEHKEDVAAAHGVNFIANQYGGDSEVDSQGRVLMPPELRRLLNMENQPVYLLYFKGAVDVYSQEQYEKEAAKANEQLDSKYAFLQSKGLK